MPSYIFHIRNSDSFDNATRVSSVQIAHRIGVNHFGSTGSESSDAIVRSSERFQLLLHKLSHGATPRIRFERTTSSRLHHCFWAKFGRRDQVYATATLLKRILARVVRTAQHPASSETVQRGVDGGISVPRACLALHVQHGAQSPAEAWPPPGPETGQSGAQPDDNVWNGQSGFGDGRTGLNWKSCPDSPDWTRLECRTIITRLPIG